MSGPPAIELRDVFRIHRSAGGGVAALQGLSLVVEEGETLVVLGPSGSGKSTLLRLLGGLDRPSAGRVLHDGSDLATLSRRSLAAWRERNLGYADQRYTRALAAELTVAEAVGLRLALGGATSAERRLRTGALLERVGLAGRAAARPRELSGGEQQRVALCAALAHRPRLLLADEPTGELDAASAREIYGLLRDLAAEDGVTTVLVSHDNGSAAIADRVVHIRDGRLAGEEIRHGGAAPAPLGEEIVVGRGGWLRLPEELLGEAGIGTRARIALREEGLLLSAARARAHAGGACEETLGPDVAAPATAAVAAVHGVTKRYGSGSGRAVVDGVTASFPAGALVAVVGPSGSGKTTLLHLLAGLVRPDGGDVEVQGQLLGRLGREELAALRRAFVGWIGQAPGLVPHLDAFENVAFGLSLRGVEPAQLPQRSGAALAGVGLGGREGQRVSRLSSGERQRVAIARAIAGDPALLLADEPTARLDRQGAAAVADLLFWLTRERGTAVVCATHDDALVERADAVLRLGGADLAGSPTPSA